MLKSIKYLAVLFLLCLGTYAQSNIEYKNFLIQWEGYSSYVYTDKNGDKIVGIGHNLTANNQYIYFKRFYNAEEVDNFFLSDLSIAVFTAQEKHPDFNSLNKNIKFTIISIIWTVGPSGYSKFSKFILSINEKVSLNRLENHLKLLEKSLDR